MHRFGAPEVSGTKVPLRAFTDERPDDDVRGNKRHIDVGVALAALDTEDQLLARAAREMSG